MDGDAEDLAEDLIAFFKSLSPEARRDYAALAERDRRFGENVGAEREEQGKGHARSLS